MTTGESRDRNWSLFYPAQGQQRIGITENPFATIKHGAILLSEAEVFSLSIIVRNESALLVSVAEKSQ